MRPFVLCAVLFTIGACQPKSQRETTTADSAAAPAAPVAPAAPAASDTAAPKADSTKH
jgi:hypothetical protein